MARKLSEAQISEIRRRYESGESKSNIVSQMHVSWDSVQRHTERERRFLSDEDIRNICNQIEGGKSKAEVARQIGVNSRTVWAHTKHIVLKAPETPEDKKHELIHRVFSGEQLPSVARELNIKSGTARGIFYQAVRNYQITDQQKNEIVSAFALGKTANQISCEIGIPFHIINFLKETKKSLRYSIEQRNTAIQAILSGKSATSVAKQMKISQTQISHWYREAIQNGEVEKPSPKISKSDDLEFKWITQLDPDLEEWRVLIVNWIEAENYNIGMAVRAIPCFIQKFLIKFNLPKKPADFLQRGRIVPDFQEAIGADSKKRVSYVNTIFNFIEWVLESPEFADHTDNEIIRLPHLYRNPINIKPNRLNDQTANTESNKVIIPYFLIADLRMRIVQGPNFGDWIWLQSLMGYDGVYGKQRASDWFSVPEEIIDRNDPDCVWRVRKRVDRPPVLEMWSPVRWVHALLHLQTTTRSGQARMVDSGEADTFIWQDGNFTLNTGPLKQGTVRNPRAQGVFRRPPLQDVAKGAKISLYFNSNKTADIGKSAQKKGFVCPWPHTERLDEDPYYWLEKLRNWQKKYNPINRLTPWTELRGGRKLSTKTNEELAQYPDTAFLFRAPEFKENPDWPIGSMECGNTWITLLSAYEEILSKEGIKHQSGEKIELINPETGRAWSTQHATRVSLITHLIIDGNVPVEIMMKIAGHARFVMTVYYTKVGITNIQNAIQVATKQLEEIKYATFERDLQSAKAEQIRDKVVFNAEDWRTVLPENPMNRNPLGWLHLHDGICLAGGNTSGDPFTPGCHNGGPVLRPSGDRSVHGPTPGGVRNCCRCRWKSAGKQHILGLAATFDNRSYHLHKKKEEAIAAERHRNELMKDKARIESNEQPFMRMRELVDAERRYESAMQKFQDLALDLVAIHNTIERIMTLPDNDSGSMALATQCDNLTLNMMIEDTTSEMLQLAGICADLELFPDLDPGTAIFEFAQLLDIYFERDGHPMVFSRLSEKEKLAQANAVMRELEKRANPENPVIGRRQVVEIIDRQESLEKILGIDIGIILKKSEKINATPISITLESKDIDNGIQ